MLPSLYILKLPSPPYSESLIGWTLLSLANYTPIISQILQWAAGILYMRQFDIFPRSLFLSPHRGWSRDLFPFPPLLRPFLTFGYDSRVPLFAQSLPFQVDIPVEEKVHGDETGAWGGLLLAQGCTRANIAKPPLPSPIGHPEGIGAGESPSVYLPWMLALLFRP